MNIIKYIYHNLWYAIKHRKMKKFYETQKKGKKSLKIVFLVQRAEVWNSVATIYEAAKENAQIDVQLVALPRYKNEKIDLTTRDTYEFCKRIDENAIEAYDRKAKKYYNIKLLNPDYIFLNIPYNHELPKEYQFQNLYKYAKLCYVPYGYTWNQNIEKSLSEINWNRSIMLYSSFIFLDSNISARCCKKYLKLSTLLYKVLYNIGYPRFDLLKGDKKNVKYRTILWLPRWTANANNSNEDNASHFFDLKDKMFEFMDNHKELKCIIRPHPLAFDNYISKGLWTEQEMKTFLEKIESSVNIELDQSGDYMLSLREADILISDFSSIVVEFFLLNKPIIYMGNLSKTRATYIQNMEKSFYILKNWTEIETKLVELAKGIDRNIGIRKEAIEMFWKQMGVGVGEKIIKILIEDFECWREG